MKNGFGRFFGTKHPNPANSQSNISTKTYGGVTVQSRNSQSGSLASKVVEDGLDLLLGELKSLFPCGLVDGAGWQRLLECAACLPASIATSIGFEHRLMEEDPRVDFCVGFSRITSEAFERSLKRAYGASANYIVESARALRETESELRRFADSGILEFDLIEPPVGDIPVPSIFFSMSADGARNGLVQDIAGWSDQTGEFSPIAHILSALPEHGKLMNAGAMLSRTGRMIRLGLGGMQRQTAIEFLHRLEWSGPIQEIDSMLKKLDGTYSSAAIALDVGNFGIGSRIGLEFFVQGKRPATGWATIEPKDWLPMIERLESLQWCSSGKGQGLRNWSGFERAYSEDAVFRIFKGINHFKLVISRDGMDAKAYTGLSIHRAKQQDKT